MQSVSIRRGAVESLKIRYSAHASASLDFFIQSGGVACAHATKSPPRVMTTTPQPVRAKCHWVPYLQEPSNTQRRFSSPGSG